MTLKQALEQARKKLSLFKFIEDPVLESEILLRYTLQIGRAQLFLQLDQEVDSAKEKLFQEWVERRTRGEPIAYIIGCREFFGLDFQVDSRVLIPRPESELLVEEAIRFSLDNPITAAADIGTGSGAIAVSLAVYLPEISIFATDISASALEVARLNCLKHGVSDRVSLLQGDLLSPLPVPVDILIANLPYVTSTDLAQRPPSGGYEPALALDGGVNGLDKVFQFCTELKGKLKPQGCALLEIGLGQSRTVMDYLRNLFPTASIKALPDLAGIERVIKVIAQGYDRV
jgi:release factor glutamine methyltransferase